MSKAHDLDECRDIFVSWKWLVGTTITFIVLLCASSFSLGYKISNVKGQLVAQDKKIVALEDCVYTLNNQISMKLDSLIAMLNKKKEM